MYQEVVWRKSLLHILVATKCVITLDKQYQSVLWDGIRDDKDEAILCNFFLLLVFSHLYCYWVLWRNWPLCHCHPQTFPKHSLNLCHKVLLSNEATTLFFLQQNLLNILFLMSFDDKIHVSEHSVCWESSNHLPEEVCTRPQPWHRPSIILCWGTSLGALLAYFEKKPFFSPDQD